ncbi:hypothetical protein [Photobacterium indicum]|uniref:hypothetical protein n=1 Tax=Photobacterium indicum TaxID=81447 RepID=UPI003D142EEB
MSNAKYSAEAKEAALSGMNEDIQNILDTIETLNSTLPSIAKEQLTELKGDIEGLERALKVVPAEYDKSFSEKQNTLIIISSKISDHIRDLNNTLKNDLEDTAKKHSKIFSDSFNARISHLELISLTKIGFISLFSSLAGGIISAFYINFVFLT